MNAPIETTSNGPASLQRLVGPRCSICKEPAGHTIGNCPACQDRDETEEEFIRTRLLLHKLAAYFGASCSHPLAAEVRDRLSWPNTVICDTTSQEETRK